ncbi:MAG TPA: bacillithiol biosynthesis deacetylase BshB1 [Terriglobales bacterium]|nr:bacillithiol biosynthesis deacetylase BshB1 [Terriglobales bacterium]
MTRSPDDSITDILAIAAHRDDVEQTCGGTLLKAAQRGQKTAILDLTRGEMGTRGTAEERANEAADAAKILGVTWRGALDIPDTRVENTHENRLKIARVIRMLRPQVVILPYWQARHPDHAKASPLGYEACFLAGLKKLDLSPVSPDSLSVTVSTENRELTTDNPFRPFKILYASLYADTRPSFVVDITAQFEQRLRSLLAYKSQYGQQSEGASLFVPEADIRKRMETMARFYGLLAGVEYAEPFVQKEVGLIEDVTAIPVQSI